jgi:hypothetical protein
MSTGADISDYNKQLGHWLWEMTRRLLAARNVLARIDANAITTVDEISSALRLALDDGKDPRRLPHQLSEAKE